MTNDTKTYIETNIIENKKGILKLELSIERLNKELKDKNVSKQNTKDMKEKKIVEAETAIDILKKEIKLLEGELPNEI